MTKTGLLSLSVLCSACVVRAPGLDSGPRSNPFGGATEPSLPPGEASDEATDDQLALAFSGAGARTGDYRVAVALTPAAASRGTFELRISDAASRRSDALTRSRG